MYGNLLLIRLVVDETILDFQVSLGKTLSINHPEVTEKVQEMRHKWKASSIAFNLVQGKVKV